MARQRFIQLNNSTHVNPDMVEILMLNTSGGRETVVVHMFSGAKLSMPSTMTMADVVAKLEGESNG